MTPVRVQRKRTKGWRMPASAIYVGRPTKWGNPFIVGSEVGLSGGMDGTGPFWGHARFFDCKTTKMSAELAVELYRSEVEYLLEPDFETIPVDHDPYGLRRALRQELRGHDLVCWCALDRPCHADVLLRLANR